MEGHRTPAARAPEEFKKEKLQIRLLTKTNGKKKGFKIQRGLIS